MAKVWNELNTAKNYLLSKAVLTVLIRLAEALTERKYLLQDKTTLSRSILPILTSYYQSPQSRVPRQLTDKEKEKDKESQSRH